MAGTMACADSPSAPVRAEVPEGAPNAMVVINDMAPDSTSATFTVTPTGGMFSMGPHHVFFPPRVICNPATSIYGTDQWDVPCQALDQPITIRADVRTSNGVPYVYFTPNLRFVPSAYAFRWVWLYMETRGAYNTSDADRFRILWFAEPGATAIDESLTDATLRTYVWPEVGLVFRRIKHFSGYQAHDGRSAAPSTLDTELAF